MPLEFLQVMLVQEGGSRSMVAMLQHILREEGIKVDQGIELSSWVKFSVSRV